MDTKYDSMFVVEDISPVFEGEDSRHFCCAVRSQKEAEEWIAAKGDHSLPLRVVSLPVFRHSVGARQYHYLVASSQYCDGHASAYEIHVMSPDDPMLRWGWNTVHANRYWVVGNPFCPGDDCQLEGLLNGSEPEPEAQKRFFRPLCLARRLAAALGVLRNILERETAGKYPMCKV